MTKSIFELEKSDVEQYMAEKGIKDCSLCNSKNTLEPVYDDDLKLVYRASDLMKYNNEKQDFITLMNGYDVLITCSHCGVYNSLTPGVIADHLDLLR